MSNNDKLWTFKANYNKAMDITDISQNTNTTIESNVLLLGNRFYVKALEILTHQLKIWKGWELHHGNIAFYISAIFAQVRNLSIGMVHKSIMYIR